MEMYLLDIFTQYKQMNCITTSPHKISQDIIGFQGVEYCEKSIVTLRLATGEQADGTWEGCTPAAGQTFHNSPP